MGSLISLRNPEVPYRCAAYVANPMPPRKTRQAPTEILLPGKSKYALPVPLVLNNTQANKTDRTASFLPFFGATCLAIDPSFEGVKLIAYLRVCQFHQLHKLELQFQLTLGLIQIRNRKYLFQFGKI